MIRSLFILCLAFTAFASFASAAEAVSFRKEVLPILGHHCMTCHNDEKQKGDLNFKSRSSVFDRKEPVLVAGHSAKSSIIALVTSLDEEERMPPKGRALNTEEISVLKRWIDEGASWDEASLKVLERKADFRLSAKPLPPGEGHPIDRWLAPYYTQHGVDATKTVDDRLFARRVWFDIIGLPPSPETLAAFLADTAKDKRERLIDRLLADHNGYAAHWMTFWQDHLRDGTRGVDEAGNPFCNAHYHVRPITPWLQSSLIENKRYDVFVRELVNPPDLPHDPYTTAGGLTKLPRDSSGFLQGIRLGGAVPTAVQSAEVQVAQNIGQVFLGSQLKCATCHDSFIDGWKQAEVWGLASVYSEKPLEMFKAEIATGKRAAPRFLSPDLDLISPTAPVRERMKQLATSLTRPENGLFARTLVNRIWAQLMGSGLVKSLDDMAEPAWHPDLLDWLAADFIAHGYDLKYLIRQILTSRAWQMPAATEATVQSAPFVFRGPALRRLTAEQFADTLYALQGRPHRAWEQRATPLFDALGRPDRQLVVTTRDSEATMLQALEVLNGRTLHELLKETISTASPPLGTKNNEPGTKNRIQQNQPTPITPGADLVHLAEQRFTLALSRAPTERERAILRTIFGANPSLDDLADVSWLTLMKPEFQLLQ